MKTLYVELGERRYPIFIGSNLNPQELLESYIHGKRVMVVSNETVAPLYLDRYKAALKNLGKTVATCILPDGEKYKNIEHLNLILMHCLRQALTATVRFWHSVVVLLEIWPACLCLFPAWCLFYSGANNVTFKWILV